MIFKSALLPSVEKCMLQSNLDEIAHLPKENISLSGEVFTFQLAFRGIEGDTWIKQNGKLELLGVPEKCVSVRRVRFIPSLMPAWREPRRDGNYMSFEPGFFPDLLDDHPMLDRIPIVYGQSHAMWIELSGMEPGKYGIEVRLTLGEESESHIFTLNVLAAELPKQEMILTQWFHADCLATYYDCEVFSERHWRIVENFIKTAVRNGINMLLTPIFTPPLDTYVGGERPTVQLCEVFKDDGKYSFRFDLLDRWCETALGCGIEYFEISHLFTQWGAAHAPKVMAHIDGEYVKIFGWESSASEGDYPEFLRAFIPAFLSHMKEKGWDRRCYFHISDEPSEEQLGQYLASKSVVAELLRGYPIMDALSSYDFYANGVVALPIPCTNHIKPFLENGVKNLWTYYCCSQHKDTSNRFFAMPGARTRAIGAALYKYDIVGFLQWGYNFYYSCHSRDFCNPYLDSTGDFWVQSGDTYSVYPSRDGRALESVRLRHFTEALADVRAMKLLESLTDKETVVSLIESVLGEVSFEKSDYTSNELLLMRDAINKKIAEITA